jgi:hypothetical protein
MISIKSAKKIREDLKLTHIVIYGIDENGMQHIATHGASVKQAEQSRDLGDQLKVYLKWPETTCGLPILERICKNCEYNLLEECFVNSKIEKRKSYTKACEKFTPRC